MQKVATMGCTVLCHEGACGADLVLTGEMQLPFCPFSSWPGDEESDNKGCCRVDAGMLSLLWSMASALQ